MEDKLENDIKDGLKEKNFDEMLEVQNGELSKSEREELEMLRKQNQQSSKPFNIYDSVNISPTTLSKVIIFGVVVIIGAIIMGMLAN